MRVPRALRALVDVVETLPELVIDTVDGREVRWLDGPPVAPVAEALAAAGFGGQVHPSGRAQVRLANGRLVTLRRGLRDRTVVVLYVRGRAGLDLSNPVDLVTLVEDTWLPAGGLHPVTAVEEVAFSLVADVGTPAGGWTGIARIDDAVCAAYGSRDALLSAAGAVAP